MNRFLLFAAAVCTTVHGQIGKPCSANETAMEIFQEVSLSGKVALITGADKGIGLEIAKALAARGATVIPGCRKSEELTATEALIKKAVPNAKVFLPSALLDLSSFKMVRNFVQGLQQFPTIDILVNDAGLANNPHQVVTHDGFELAFQIDYPSQWLLTYLLMPQIRKGKGRVVNLVSKAYRMACPMAKRFQCMELERLPPPVITGSQKVPILGIPVSNYGIARLLMIRWTEDLARRETLAGTGVSVTAVNPGFVNTSMADRHNLSPLFLKLACTTEGRRGAPCPTLPSQGALTPTFLSLSPESKIPNGKFYEWCEPAPVDLCLDVLDGPWIPTECSGGDQKYQEGLWNLTAKWVKNFTAPLEQRIVGPPTKPSEGIAQIEGEGKESKICHSIFATGPGHMQSGPQHWCQTWYGETCDFQPRADPGSCPDSGWPYCCTYGGTHYIGEKWQKTKCVHPSLGPCKTQQVTVV